jgi:hypothetical protein
MFLPLVYLILRNRSKRMKKIIEDETEGRGRPKWSTSLKWIWMKSNREMG